jgi:hypothetical protein
MIKGGTKAPNLFVLTEHKVFKTCQTLVQRVSEESPAIP